MRKISALLVVPVLSLVWASGVCAKEAEGIVRSFDEAKGEVVLQSGTGGLETVVVHENVFPSVKVGSKAKAVFMSDGRTAETFIVEVE